MGIYRIYKLVEGEQAKLIAEGQCRECYGNTLKKMKATRKPTCFAIEHEGKGYVYAMEKGESKWLYNYPC